MDRLTKNAPLAEAFVYTVNSKYEGDIGSALKDKDMRSWAHALGLVDENKAEKLALGDYRIGAINHILHDDTLDTNSKLKTLKILMH